MEVYSDCQHFFCNSSEELEKAFNFHLYGNFGETKYFFKRRLGLKFRKILKLVAVNYTELFFISPIGIFYIVYVNPERKTAFPTLDRQTFMACL